MHLSFHLSCSIATVEWLHTLIKILPLSERLVQSFLSIIFFLELWNVYCASFFPLFLKCETVCSVVECPVKTLLHLFPLAAESRLYETFSILTGLVCYIRKSLGIIPASGVIILIRVEMCFVACQEPTQTDSITSVHLEHVYLTSFCPCLFRFVSTFFCWFCVTTLFLSRINQRIKRHFKKLQYWYYIIHINYVKYKT